MAFSLIPKEEKFFDLFEVQGERIAEVGRTFKEMISHWSVESPLVEKIRDLEHEADMTTHEIIDKLNRSFITPFDREDIHQLTSKMDDVIDLIQGTASRMQRYKVNDLSSELVQLADILQQSTDVVRKAIVGLRDISNPRRTLDYCIEINRLENAGDQMMELAMEKLFSGNHNPIDVIKWKEIYELTEAATDLCEDVANAIESIVVKHG